MNSEEQNDFDALLGEALRNYADVEPNAWAGQRILANVRREMQSRNRILWWRLTYVAALLVTVFSIYSGKRSGNRDGRYSIAKAQETAGIGAEGVIRREETQDVPAGRRAHMVTARLPSIRGERRPDDDSPDSLTLQNPEDESTIATSAMVKIDPIRIAKIEIPPIPSSDVTIELIEIKPIVTMQ